MLRFMMAGLRVHQVVGFARSLFYYYIIHPLECALLMPFNRRGDIQPTINGSSTSWLRGTASSVFRSSFPSNLIKLYSPLG